MNNVSNKTPYSPTNLERQMPMLATSARFLIAPLLYFVLISDQPGWRYLVAGLFIVGSITDWLDGYWARKFNAATNMGKFMDPIADKVLVLTALVLLLYMRRIDPFTPSIILARDIFIGGLRSVAAADGVVIDAKPKGKYKTALQMISIPCMFLDLNVAGIELARVGEWGLWVSTVLSILSAMEYTTGYFHGAKKGKGL
jgi:CDP-diacylglycerol--glycerol-3-phosphate 3-phosphatidyltransferase